MPHSRSRPSRGRSQPRRGRKTRSQHPRRSRSKTAASSAKKQHRAQRDHLAQRSFATQTNEYIDNLVNQALTTPAKGKANASTNTSAASRNLLNINRGIPSAKTRAVQARHAEQERRRKRADKASRRRPSRGPAGSGPETITRCEPYAAHEATVPYLGYVVSPSQDVQFCERTHRHEAQLGGHWPAPYRSMDNGQGMQAAWVPHDRKERASGPSASLYFKQPPAARPTSAPYDSKHRAKQPFGSHQVEKKKTKAKGKKNKKSKRSKASRRSRKPVVERHNDTKPIIVGGKLRYKFASPKRKDVRGRKPRPKPTKAQAGAAEKEEEREKRPTSAPRSRYHKSKMPRSVTSEQEAAEEAERAAARQAAARAKYQAQHTTVETQTGRAGDGGSEQILPEMYRTTNGEYGKFGTALQHALIPELPQYRPELFMDASTATDAAVVDSGSAQHVPEYEPEQFTERAVGQRDVSEPKISEHRSEFTQYPIEHYCDYDEDAASQASDWIKVTPLPKGVRAAVDKDNQTSVKPTAGMLRPVWQRGTPQPIVSVYDSTYMGHPGVEFPKRATAPAGVPELPNTETSGPEMWPSHMKGDEFLAGTLVSEYDARYTGHSGFVSAQPKAHAADDDDDDSQEGMEMVRPVWQRGTPIPIVSEYGTMFTGHPGAEPPKKAKPPAGVPELPNMETSGPEVWPSHMKGDHFLEGTLVSEYDASFTGHSEVGFQIDDDEASQDSGWRKVTATPKARRRQGHKASESERRGTWKTQPMGAEVVSEYDAEYQGRAAQEPAEVEAVPKGTVIRHQPVTKQADQDSEGSEHACSHSADEQEGVGETAESVPVLMSYKERQRRIKEMNRNSRDHVARLLGDSSLADKQGRTSGNSTARGEGSYKSTQLRLAQMHPSAQDHVETLWKQVHTSKTWPPESEYDDHYESYKFVDPTTGEDLPDQESSAVRVVPFVDPDSWMRHPNKGSGNVIPPSSAAVGPSTWASTYDSTIGSWLHPKKVSKTVPKKGKPQKKSLKSEKRQKGQPRKDPNVEVVREIVDGHSSTPPPPRKDRPSARPVREGRRPVIKAKPKNSKDAGTSTFEPSPGAFVRAPHTSEAAQALASTQQSRKKQARASPKKRRARKQPVWRPVSTYDHDFVPPTTQVQRLNRCEASRSNPRGF